MAGMTPLSVLVLGLLCEQPMHPYEMYQTLIYRRDDRNCKVRPGTLYHQVGRLVDQGYAVETGVAREGNRPERTIYEATEQGRQALLELVRRMVAEPAEEYPEFRVAVSELENLPLDDAITALESRVAALEMHLGELDSALELIHGKNVAERFYLDVVYARTMWTAELDWVRALAGRMRDGGIEWSPPDTRSRPQGAYPAANTDNATTNPAKDPS